MSSLLSLVSAGKALEYQVDTASNNLANAATDGYKADQPTFREVLSKATRVLPQSEEELFQGHENLDLYVGMDKSAVMIDDTGKNFGQGTIRSTQNPLDVAIGSEGFFTISTPQGERFTKAGNFSLNGKNELTTSDGFQVMGEKGPIVINGIKVNIDEDGGINVDGQVVDKLKIAKFRDPSQLQKLGKSFFAPLGKDNVPVAVKEPQVKQGAVEGSNVNTVQEMVRMIGANRSYENVQNALKNMDRMNEKAISISRIG